MAFLRRWLRQALFIPGLLKTPSALLYFKLRYLSMSQTVNRICPFWWNGGGKLPDHVARLAEALGTSVTRVFPALIGRQVLILTVETRPHP